MINRKCNCEKEKVGNGEYCFSEKLAFSDFLKKLMLRRSSCFEKVALL